jgi:hypothetical protein
MHDAMKTYEVPKLRHLVLNLDTKWSFSLRQLYSREKGLKYPLKGGWLGPEVGLGVVK